MGLANFGPLDELAQGVPLQWQDVSRIGSDLRIVARVAGRDQF